MFIQELSKHLDNSDVNITFSKNGDIITAIVVPKPKNDKISDLPPIVATGTAKELDEQLVAFMIPVFDAVQGFKVTGVAEAVEAIKVDEETANRPDKVKVAKVVAPKVEKVNPKSVFEQATTLFGEGKYSEALVLYKQATELKPDSKPYKESLILCQRWVDSVAKMNINNSQDIIDISIEEAVNKAVDEHNAERSDPEEEEVDYGQPHNINDTPEKEQHRDLEADNEDDFPI